MGSLEKPQLKDAGKPSDEAKYIQVNHGGWKTAYLELKLITLFAADSRQFSIFRKSTSSIYLVRKRRLWRAFIGRAALSRRNVTEPTSRLTDSTARITTWSTKKNTTIWIKYRDRFYVTNTYSYQPRIANLYHNTKMKRSISEDVNLACLMHN